MNEKPKFRSLELAGEELDSFIGNLVDKVYGQVWANVGSGSDEATIKDRLQKSIIEALKEYADYKSDE